MKKRNVWSHEAKRPGVEKGDNQQVVRELRETSREEQQACDGDRLKGMGKKEPSLERLRQKVAALGQALLQCWEETPKLLVLPFFCYQLQSAKYTRQTSPLPASQVVGGCNNLL